MKIHEQTKTDGGALTETSKSGNSLNSFRSTLAEELKKKKSEYYDSASSHNDLCHSDHAAEALLSRRYSQRSIASAESAMLEQSLFESCLVSYRRVFNGGQPVEPKPQGGRCRLDNEDLKAILGELHPSHETVYNAAGKIVAHQNTRKGIYGIDNLSSSDTGLALGVRRELDLSLIETLRELCAILKPVFAEKSVSLFKDADELTLQQKTGNSQLNSNASF